MDALAGVAHSGQGALVWVARTRRVIWVVEHRPRTPPGAARSHQAISRKDVGVCRAMKARSSSGNMSMSSVERHIHENNTASLDIPEWYITKSEKEPIRGGLAPHKMAPIT